MNPSDEEVSTTRQELDERTLVIRSQRGEKAAFGELVRRYMQRAYFTALGITGSGEAALDLSQDAFIRAYRAIKKFEPSRPFFAWYYQILRNLCFNYLRDRKRHAAPFSEIGESRLSQIGDASQRPDEALQRKEIQEAVWQAMNRLKPEEREILILREFEGYSYNDIAGMLNIPVGTVMSRLYYARKSLRDQLSDRLKAPV